MVYDLLEAMPLVVLGVLVLMQTAALLWLKGLWRRLAFVPLLAMAAAITIAVLGVLAGSNLAPIWVVFAALFALLWLGVLWLLRAIVALASY